MRLQVVSQGAISAPMYSTKGPSMIQSLYPTAFPLKHQQKVCNFATVSITYKHSMDLNGKDNGGRTWGLL